MGTLLSTSSIILDALVISFKLSVVTPVKNFSANCGFNNRVGNNDIRFPINIIQTDAPATTSAITYHIRGYNQTSSLTVNCSHGNSVRTMTVYEYDGS